MNLHLEFVVLFAVFMSVRGHTHEEIAKCSLREVHKERQSVIESPNYPNNYDPDTCWDYVIRSPYKCPTTYHVQFLDFYLEHSEGCKNDYLAIGLENIDDDMDILCGQVVGIKKYHTPDGVLRLRFLADSSPRTTGKGFKLLVTRLACEREEIWRQQKKDDDVTVDNDEDDDTVTISAPAANLQPPQSELTQLFRNLTEQKQYQIISLPPVFGFNYPTQLPSPPYPAIGTVYVPVSNSGGPSLNYPGSNLQNNSPQPCLTDSELQRQLPNTVNYYGALHGKQLVPSLLGGYLPSHPGSSDVSQVGQQQASLVGSSNDGFYDNPREQYIGTWASSPSLPRSYDSTIDSLEACCVSAFHQKRFYLSSPGFPRTVFSNILPNNQKRDCVFHIQKFSSKVCRLRLALKFFDFGQSYQGTGSYAGNIGSPAIRNTQDICGEDFIELDNQRFCGCRSGYTFTAYWTTATDKKLRMRMGYSSVPSGGFLLELVQEECSEADVASMTTQRPQTGSTLTTINSNVANDQFINAQQPQRHLYGHSYTNQQQQQQNVGLDTYGGSYIGQQFGFQNPYFFQQQQHVPQIHAINPSNLQQQNPFLTQLQSPQNTNPSIYPSQLASGYVSYISPQNVQHNLLPQQSLATNSYGLPQIRYARSYGDQQPITIVETNSTRKEYYYTENDPLHYNTGPTVPETSSKWDRQDTNVNERNSAVGRQEGKCSFDMSDILRLSVDILWITKPICYAPQRNWLTNWIG